VKIWLKVLRVGQFQVQVEEFEVIGVWFKRNNHIKQSYKESNNTYKESNKIPIQIICFRDANINPCPFS